MEPASSDRLGPFSKRAQLTWLRDRAFGTSIDGRVRQLSLPRRRRRRRIYDGRIDLEPETIDRVLKRMRPAQDALARLHAQTTPEETRDVVRAVVAAPFAELGGPAVEDLRDAYSELMDEITDFRLKHRPDRSELDQQLQWAKEDFDIAAEFVQRAATDPGSVDPDSLREAVEDSTRRLEAAHAALAEFSEAWSPEALREFHAEIAGSLERFDRLVSSLVWQLEASLPSPLTRKLNDAWEGAGRVVRDVFGPFHDPHDGAR